MPEQPSPRAQSARLCAHDRLTLRSQLSDLSLVSAWVRALTSRCCVSERTGFAIDLCLEEALSNIIRHGYAGDPTRKIEVEFKVSAEGVISFTIEDSAPHFRPFDPSQPLQAPAAGALEDVVPGGHGIPLMRKFADAVDWEPLPKGNRLTLRFSVS